MTNLDHLISFMAMAAMILALLTIGTLVAADVLPRRKHDGQAHDDHRAA